MDYSIVSNLSLFFSDGNKHYVLRGCQLARSDNLDICLKVKKEKDDNDNLRMKYCSLCSGDGCNAAVQKGPLMSLVGTIAATLVTFLIYYRM